jgi:hypothetical protein
LSYLHEELDGHLELDIPSSSSSPSSKKVFKFPRVGQHTYQTYLRTLQPIQGAITELIRVNFHDIPSMIEDFLLMEDMRAHYALPNTYPHHLTRSFHSICLESLTSVSTTGQVMNSQEGLEGILQALDVNVTSTDLLQITAWVNRGTEAHQTNHTSSSRGEVERALRWYDQNYFDGLLHKYEKMVNCGTSHKSKRD